MNGPPKLPAPVPPYPKYRCQADRTTRYDNDPEGVAAIRCSCSARHLVQGQRLCARHAGQVALDMVLNGVTPPKPLDLIMHCPSCNGRHIDAGQWADKAHHTHACQHCGTNWRPAVEPTRGVQFLRGFKND